MADGLLGNVTAGMSQEEADTLLKNLYQSVFMRAPDAAGAEYWSNLLTSGQQTPDQVRANLLASPEAQPSQKNLQVPFGSQIVNNQVQPIMQYEQRMPTYQNFAPADAYGSAFERSLAYQSALPSMLPAFNPAEMPNIYPNVALNPYRLDITNIQLPQWLKDAIAKGTPATDAATQTNKSGILGVRED
jgi:hypothetical protein